MKKCGKLLATLLVLALALTTIFAFTACFDDDGKKDAEYTIVFLDESDAELATVKVKEGVVPEFTGTLPAVPAETAEYTYSWGWDKEIVPATADATYKLTRVSTKRSYEVKFMNGETAVSTVTVEYGAEATLPENPTKDATVDKAYTFDGWYTQAEGGEKVTDFTITGATVYYAHFTDSARTYTVTFKNGDVELQSGKVEYGVVPEYKGETPVKAGDAQYTYTFKGWDKAIVAVTGDVVYTAQFDQTVNEYDVTFKNGDEVLKTIKLAYGSEITIPEDVKVEGYAIIGWEPEFEPVTTNAEYVAILARVLTQADKDNFSAIISANPDDNYVLGEDIDFGNAELPHVANFGGIFDGMGYKLKNFKLKLGDLNGAGDWAFAFIIQNAGTIRNVGLYYSAPAKKGNNHSGVIRHNYGKIENVYVKISIDGEAPNYMGTVVGANIGSGTIDNVVVSWSGSTTSVVGPVAGANHNGTIRNAHAICNGVIAVTDLPYAAGQSFGSETIENCANYADTAAFLAAVDFTANGWSKYWSVKDGKLVFGEEDPEPVEETTILTQANMANFVSVINANPNGKYELGSDIDFGGADIGAIGEFTGVLDGKGYALKNFNPSLNGSTSLQWSYAVIAKNSGTIKNIIIDYSLKGNNGHEAFVYENAGLITNVYVKVKFIKAGWSNASLVGTNKDSGIVTNVVAVLTKDETVTNECFGAVVGSDQNGQIKYCYGVCGNVIPSANDVFKRPNFEGFGNGTYVGNANYDTLENLVAGATFNEADGWDMTYFAKTFKAVNDLKNAQTV